jgi:hypothetical protein
VELLRHGLPVVHLLIVHLLIVLSADRAVC